MKRIAIMSALLGSTILTGCTSLSVPTQPNATYKNETPAKRQEQLTTVTSWNASGALSVQQPGKSAMIMRYEWQQMGANTYRVNLSGSLNIGSVVIIGQPNKVTLQRGNEAPISARTAEELMQRQLGWTLPIPSLWYWARGLPAPGPVQSSKYDSYGHLVMLSQQGWRLQFSDYKTVQGVDLPQVIQLNARISARLVVKEWQLHKS